MINKILSELVQNNNVRENLIALKNELKKEGAVYKLRYDSLYTSALLPFFLTNADAKVRKNAAIIMGIVNEDGYMDKLFDAYLNEKTLFVKSAYLQAMLAYDHSAYDDRLFEIKKELENGDHGDDIKHVAEELKYFDMLFPQKVGKKHTFRMPNQKISVVLTTNKDAVQALCDAFPDSKKVFCGAMLETDDIQDLYNHRMFRELLFPLNNMGLCEKNKLAESITSGNLIELLKLMHDNADEPFRFRVTSKTLDVAAIATKIQALSKGRLVNMASDYEVEIKVLTNKYEKCVSFLKLHTIKDKRFSYRKNYVAASIKPVNAAMAMWMVKDYLKAQAQVLDPFCGVGTMLIERNMVERASHMYGVDIFGTAIEGARENADILGLPIHYICKDYFEFTHDYLFDEIVTNMPVFKPGEGDEFYKKFFEKSKYHLVDTGIIIMISNEKNLIKKYLRLNKEYKLLREYIMDAKEGKAIYVISFSRGE